MTRPTLKERQYKLREETIRESTTRLLKEKGFEAMTMDDVANDVGISKATLYQHFKSKEHLAVEVILHAMSRLEFYIESIDPTAPAINRLRDTMRWIIATRFGDPALDFCAAESTVKPLLRKTEEFARLDRMLMGRLADLIDSAKAEGDICPELCTPVLAQAFVSCMQDAAYDGLLRDGKCTIHELETTLMGMISSSSKNREAAGV